MLIVLLSLLQSSLLNLFNSDMYHCPQAPEDVALHYWHPNNGWSNPKIQSNQFQLVPLDHNAQLIQVRCVWWDRLQLQVSLSNDLIDCLMMFDDVWWPPRPWWRWMRQPRLGFHLLMAYFWLWNLPHRMLLPLTYTQIMGKEERQLSQLSAGLGSWDVQSWSKAGSSCSWNALERALEKKMQQRGRSMHVSDWSLVVFRA